LSLVEYVRQARRKQALEPTMNEWEEVEIQDLCMSSSQRCETVGLNFLHDIPTLFRVQQYSR